MKVALAVTLIVVIYGQLEAQTAQRYCGRQFSNMVAALCWETVMVKRDGSWWMSQEKARALGSLRGKRGPAEECCAKPCTVEELLTYC
nr:insulin-like peptide 4 [Hyphantria cunea]